MDTRLPGGLRAGLTRARALQPVSVGATPALPVAETAHATLRRYGPVDGPPLLVVYSFVNRAYILDINPRRSVLARLAAAGYAVHLLDWHPPDSTNRFDTLDDYLLDDLDEAVAVLGGAHRPPHLLGVCQGGVLALCYAAAFPDRVRTLTTLATPVDFHTEHDHLYRLSRDVDFESLVAALGNIPADALNAVFTSLKPFQLLGQRYLALADIADNDDALRDFLRMERWMYDSPDQAGYAFLQFAREFYQRNRLLAGDLVLADRPVDPALIRAPVFNAYAQDDHLVPAAAAAALGPALGHDDYRALTLPGGHLGVFISGTAHQRLYPELVDWLDAH